MEIHSIESLDQFVHSTIHPATLLPATPEQINGYMAMTIELKESLRTQLLRDMLCSKTEQETKLLIERHQIIIANVLNILFNYRHYDSLKCDVKQFYERVIAQLEQVIFFLKDTFGCYFNACLSLPLPCRLRELHEIKRLWKTINKTMPVSELNIRLMTILDHSIKSLYKISEETIVTYRQISYFKSLLKDISCYLSTSMEAPMYNSLMELLIYWNFNELAFVREICNQLKVEVIGKESDESRLEVLRSFIKKMNQLSEKNNAFFNMAQSTAKEMILQWVYQELSFLELTDDFSESKEVQEDTKIHTSLSVPVLALLTRLFKDSGIFTNTNQLEILKFMSSHFTTQRKLEVSFGHLRSKYYQIDECTKKKVFEHLMEMAKQCKKL